MRGLLGDRAEAWRQRAIEALALVEAGIDFSDEGDVPKDLLARALAIARPLNDEIAAALAGAERGERLREGLWVVIAGPPNAGKSTLLNRLAQREAAIVSPIAGTTRDVIEVHLDLKGYPVNLVDTAGIREASDDPVEQEGMRRAREQAARADLVLWLIDGAVADSPLPARSEASGPALDRGQQVRPDRRPDAAAAGVAVKNAHDVHFVSAATGAGLDALMAADRAVCGELVHRRAGAGDARAPARDPDRSGAGAGGGGAAGQGGRGRGAGGGAVAAVREWTRPTDRAGGRRGGLEVIFRDFCVGK